MAAPAQLGKYAISEVLGKGAMGVVYKGFDPHIRRVVALKTIRKDLVDEEQAATLLARFRNEAQAAGRLSHPGIVGVYEWGEADDVVFLAMEYVEGHSLREYFVRGTRFDERDAVSVMVQLLDALQYAHEQGVWHRDIKPANLIVMKNGKLKIADFGIARIESSTLTQVGAIMGTPGYMAPEQYAGGAVDWRADIFSAGVVMYQLVSGVRPFTGAAEAIAYKICHEQAAAPSAADPGRGAAHLDAVVMTALAKDPQQRFQDARAFRDAVLAASAEPVSPALSEETILNEPARAVAQSDPAHPSQPSRPPRPSQPPASNPGQPATQTAPPPGWEAATLRQIELQLMRLLGPVGKVLVRRGATRTTDIDELYRILAESLPSPDERSSFLAARPRSAVTGAPRDSGAGTAASAAAGANVQLTPEAIEQATRRLAAYLGPIAKLAAKKAAAQTGSLRHFHHLLAENLADAGERDRFLRDVGAD
jgi:serine/threonine-protein kinase